MSVNVPVGQPDEKANVRRGVARWVIRETMGTIITAVILFVAAGRWDWIWGWVLVAVYAAWIMGMALAVIPTHPELLAERVGPRKGTKQWDVVIMSIGGVAELVKYVVAGLDARWGWSLAFPVALQIAGAVVALLGHALVVWATWANAFFAQTVRIQTERGHTVATGGPYRYVRHPGYVGSILFFLATPVLLGSWWALAPGVFGALLMIIRTALEDRTLQEELPGYAEYAARVRYRLLPGIW